MGATSGDDPSGSSITASALTASDDKSRTEHRRSRSKMDRTRSERGERDKDGHRSSLHKSKSSRSSKLMDGESSLAGSTSHRRHRSSREKEGRDRDDKDRGDRVKVKDRDRDGERERERERQERQERHKKNASMSDLVPEMNRTGSRVSAYPTFSKVHSRECVNSREDLSTSAKRASNPYTPDPTETDLGSGERQRSKSVEALHRSSSTRKDGRPPSPPETDMSEEKRRSHTSTPRSMDAPDRPKSRTSGGPSRSNSRRDDKSKLSRTSSQATYKKSPTSRLPTGFEADDEYSVLSDDRTAGARSAATSVLPKRTASKRDRKLESLDAEDSPASVQDSSPRTPTTTPQFPPSNYLQSEKRSYTPRYADEDRPTPAATPMTDMGPPPPPPPPPPPLDIQEVPRIDYLLQNGGLPQPISKHFLSVLPRHYGMRPSNPPLVGPDVLFTPFFNLLDQYQNIIHKQGSVAVATGHKSVARRLLDRLEDVFSRDLPEEGCGCVMCERRAGEHRGLGWGEVLERVGGRVELPQWPPFDFASLGANAIEQLGHMPPRSSSPVQLDPDIAEEFREHYLRQSKKVRSAVDKWMDSNAEEPAPPPQEMDDETLEFAILTSLEDEERPYFNALLLGARELAQTVRAPTPNVRKPRVDFIVKCGLSLQRLYRLPQVPRDAETAMYLVKNPFHHDLLVTIVDINPQEWEILTSGRFDGFLWSGADDDGVTPTEANPGSRGATPASGMGMFSPPPSRDNTRSGMGYRPPSGMGSRNTTPFSGVYSRGATPTSFISLSSSTTPGYSRQAVSHDEEVEIAVLAEVEREIYQGMEQLEDAFEKLHHRAEMVRNALRQRNAGLMMSIQNRKGANGIDVLPQSSGDSTRDGYARPGWANGDDDSESDWDHDSESLAPDDSASNISSSRHRRPKRRTERRTPAAIDEEDEE
ncbi:hypothetical protein PG996_007617 [Apiospora saccharicola]|uniref:5-methylcytosine g t mismatch-specific dna n=1 Tax=Apiospora saccharicola TaxID=335842 RepID=A0ABR1VBC5_9PEZI